MIMMKRILIIWVLTVLSLTSLTGQVRERVSVLGYYLFANKRLLARST